MNLLADYWWVALIGGGIGGLVGATLQVLIHRLKKAQQYEYAPEPDYLWCGLRLRCGICLTEMLRWRYHKHIESHYTPTTTTPTIEDLTDTDFWES